MFLNFISLMTKCFSLLNVTVKTDVKRKFKKTRENKVLLAIFTPATSPLVHIVLLKEMKYSNEVFQCLIYYYYGYNMANTGDESMATQPALHQMQARLYIAHYICLIIDNHKLYLTKIQHYVTGFDKILDPIYYDYQYIFLHMTYLASLLFNENVTRPQSRTKEVA